MRFLKKVYKQVLLTLIVVALLGYGYWLYEHKKEVIAKVGQFEITKAEFKKEMFYRGGEHLSELNQKALLEEMILKKLLLNKAYGDELPSESSIQREYNALLMGKIRERYLEDQRKKITLSLSDLEMYYTEHKEDYRIPLKREFAILFFKKRAKNKEQEKAIIFEKFAEVIALRDENKLPIAQKGFGSYAIDYSEHQASRYRGGELGWFTQGKMVNWEQKVLDIGFKLKDIGAISNVIETKKGYYLVRLMNETKAKYKSFEKVQGRVKHQLLMAKQKAIKTEFYQRLRTEFSVEIDLKKLDDFNQSVNLKNEEKRPPMGLL